MDINEFTKLVSSLNSEELALLKSTILSSKSIMILGNGGSNAISCHIAEDYTKVLKIKTICFGDSARMSCYANDYGWDMAYLNFLRDMLEPDMVVILISSSGNSKNIINCAQFCTEHSIQMITLSGFSSDNELKSKFGDKSILHFWVDSIDYGIVECIHELILHSVI